MAYGKNTGCLILILLLSHTYARSYLHGFTVIPGAKCSQDINLGWSSYFGLRQCAKACRRYGRSCAAIVIEHATMTCRLKTALCLPFNLDMKFDLYINLN